MGHKNEDNRSWHAVDTVTGEMCPHHHHTDTSALRCGRAAFGPDRAKAVKVVDDDRKCSKIRGRGDKRRAMHAQADVAPYGQTETME